MKARFYVNLITFPLDLVVAGIFIFIALKRGNGFAWLFAGAMGLAGVLTLSRIVTELRQKPPPSGESKEDRGSA
jgi:hypothetical protein